MKNLALILSLAFVLSACEPKTSQIELPPATEVSTGQVASISLGQSWTVVDDKDVKAVWERTDSKSSVSSAMFETTYKDADGLNHKINLDVSVESSDRVLITRKNNAGEAMCNYEGRIWTETDLDSYDAFSEDPIPENRPAFYRIITGTYICNGQGEPRAWIAKVEE